MRYLMLILILLTFTAPAHAGRWDAIVSVSTSNSSPEIDANALQGDTLLLVDATLGSAGLRLHACPNNGSFKFVGLSKVDPTSNPVPIRMDTGVSVGGYSKLALVERDDVIVLGCGLGRWFLESRSYAVDREDAVNRTVVASNLIVGGIQLPRVIDAEQDRSGIERIVANTSAPAKVILPTMDHCGGVPGYACTYDIKIYRVGAGSLAPTPQGGGQVFIYAPTGRAFEADFGPKKLCLPDQTIDLHYDGAQWRVQNKYPDDEARGTPCP